MYACVEDREGGEEEMEVTLKLFMVLIMLLSVLLFFIDTRKGHSQVEADKAPDYNDEEFEDLAMVLKHV